MPAPPTILMFDSGLGGLTVFRETVKARPDANYVYVADDTLFPYSRIAEGTLVEHVVALIGNLIVQHRPDLTVIACNTASTLVLPQLRARYSVPFVGTVPAIKPACAVSASKRVSVLGTEATVSREYTRALIRDYSQGCEVTLVGSARLASLAEAALRGEEVADADISREIAPCFVDTGDHKTDTVVLACTHYPLMTDRLDKLAPWPVAWIDPAPAIARRVVDLIGPASTNGATGEAQIVFTSGRPCAPALVATLAHYGLREAVTRV